MTRTGIAALLATLMAAPLAAHPDLQRTFAGCAGRYSAEMEHAWLMQDVRADHFEGRRATFVSLLEATADPATLPRMMHFRIEAKLAHRQLLTRISFGTAPGQVAQTERLAEKYLLVCDRLLLDS